MHTLSSHTANHIRSCPLTYQEYASYLPGNLRCIFYSVSLRIPPSMHSVRLVFLFVYSLRLFFRCDGFWLFGHSPSTSSYALTSATSSRVKPRCLSALYSDGKNGSGASLNSVRFRYFFLPISRSVVSSAVRLLCCGGVVSALRLPQPRLMRWWTQSIDMPFCSASARSASV